MTIDIDALKQDKRPQSSTLVHALIDRLEAAEKERDDVAQQLVQSEIGKREISEAHNAVTRRLSVLADENTALRAKITEMEKQAPTHWSCNVLQADASWKEEVGREIPPDGYYSIRDIKPLYALPGAKTQGEEK